MHLRFINPNFHVILVHYPLGVFVLGVVLELIGFLWRRSTLRNASRWMIVLGGLLTLPAATSGIFALTDCKHQGIDDARYHMLRMHVIYMGIASIVAVVCAVVGLGASDKWRKRLYAPLLIGVVAAWGLMVMGAWHAGETINQHGTSISIIKVKTVTDDDNKEVKDANGNIQKKTVLVPLKDETHPDIMTAVKNKDYDELTNYYAGGTLQNHMIAAGLAFAVAFFAMGLAIRRVHSSSVAPEIPQEPFHPTPSMSMSGRGDPRRVTDDISVLRSFNPGTDVGPKPQPAIPTGRIWLLAVMLLLGAASVGYWCAAGENVLTKTGWSTFTDKLHSEDPAVKLNRPTVHVILGVSMVVITLICAIMAAAAPKKPLLLGFFSLLLTAVISAQIWMGVLLTFEKNAPDGPLMHFQTADEAKAQEDRMKSATPAPAPAAPATTTGS